MSGSLDQKNQELCKVEELSGSNAPDIEGEINNKLAEGWTYKDIITIMGFVNTEQTVAIIEAVGEAVHPEFIGRSEPNMNFSYLLWLAVIPVLLGFALKKLWGKKK